LASSIYSGTNEMQRNTLTHSVLVAEVKTRANYITFEGY